MTLEMIEHKPETQIHPTPILFVHGAFHSAWCWEAHFIPWFKKQGFHCYTVNLRGHGNSEINGSLRRVRIREYAEDIAYAVQKIGQPPFIMGHSMGGFALQTFLETNLVPGAILLASTPPTGVLKATLRFTLNHPLRMLWASLSMNMVPLIVGNVALTREFLFSKQTAQDELETYHDRMEGESFLAFIDMLGLDLPKSKKVQSPILVIGSDVDTIVSGKDVEKTAKAYGVEPRIFPGRGHDMMLDHGWQEVADFVIEWLNGKK